ncbi:MAG: adenylate/guanylate cyclase domain-containing protein [Roseiflexaceae bacterium]
MRISSTLDQRLTGTRMFRFWRELFGNTLQFPIAHLILEALLGEYSYWLSPSPYLLTAASVIQAFALSHWEVQPNRHRLLGNLIGPAIYSAFDGLIEGVAFLQQPQHWAYWGFAALIGLLQTIRPQIPPWLRSAVLVLESVIRASILFVTYAIAEALQEPNYTSVATFFADPTHDFIAIAVGLLGLTIGIANLTAAGHLRQLRRTSAELRVYAEWLLGRQLLELQVTDPQALTLTRRERTVLFMDIRGFTHWSDTHAPEQVVVMLNQYYQLAEEILKRQHVVKWKCSADEVMAVFDAPADAAHAALELSQRTHQLLAAEQIATGIGLHTGVLVEGLLGSAGVQFYDVIGDTVNVAKRIESAAAADEVLASLSTIAALGDAVVLGPERTIAAKGKTHGVVVAPLRMYHRFPAGA